MRLFCLIKTLLILFFLLLFSSPLAAQQKRMDLFSICIENESDSLEVSGISLHFFDDEIELLLYQTEGKRTHTLKAGDAGITVDGKLFDTGRMRIRSTQNWTEYKGKIYREDLIAVRLPNNHNKIALVNEIQLESYLYGLINKECLKSWPIEAKKAQAVAARSYALHRKISLPRKVCDLGSSALDQVYGGYSAEDEEARKAVEQTRGEVLVHNNKVAKAYYHSTCGGITASSESIWNDPQPYLVPQKCPTDSQSPAHDWIYTISKSELGKKLGLNYSQRKQFIFDIPKRDDSTRVKKVRVFVKGTKIKEFTGEKFRKAIGYGKLKSTLFSFKIKGGRVIFTGHGLGHGVGMCQWGAAGFAKQGMKYKSILGYYYPGTMIRRIY